MLRRSLVILPVTLSVIAGAVTAQRADWPAFRGPNLDGVATNAAPPSKWSAEENVRWKVVLPGPGSSSPIVVGDRIYVTCYSGYGAYLDDGGDPKKLKLHLVCADRNTGDLLWTRTVDGPLEKKAPRVQITEHGFASPTPICDGTTIFVYFGRAGVYAFDLDGKQKWRADLGMPSKEAPPATNGVERGGKLLTLRWGSAASPVLHDGMVIVNSSEENNSIRALDQKTGDLIWKRESANLEGCASTPIVAGTGKDAVVVLVLGGEVWGLAPKTGALIWRIETGTRGGMSPTPVADERLVYTFGGSGKSHAIRFRPGDTGTTGKEANAADAGSENTAGKKEQVDKKEEGETFDGEDEIQPVPSPRVAWRSENLGIPSPVLHDGLLFLVRTDGTAACIRAKDGSKVFKGRLEGRTSSVYASPLFAGGKLYVVSRKRGTFVYSADGEFKLLGRNELDDDSQFNASPAVVGAQLFIRSDKHLYCIAEG